MRASSLLILLAAFSVVLLSNAGCERDATPEDDPASADEQSTESTDTSAENNGLIASGGVVELSIEEMERAVHRVRIVAPRTPDGTLPTGDPEWIKEGPAQVNLARNLVHFQIVRHAAAERGLQITPEEERAFIADHETLNHYLPLFEEDNEEDAAPILEELASFDLTIEDVRHLAHDMIYNEKLTDVLTEEFSDDKLWAIYQSARNEADLIVAQLQNSPSSQELDNAVRRLDAEIRAQYRDNRNDYMIPASTRVITLQADRDGDPQEIEAIVEEAATRLHSEEDPSDIAADLGLTLRMAHLTSSQNHPATRSDIAATGHTLAGARGPHAWRVEKHVDRHRRDLDRPLIREIASQLLRTEGITPSNQEQTDSARAILQNISWETPDEGQRQQLLTTLNELPNTRATHTGLFSVESGNFIPELGLSEELMKAVRELTLEDPVTEPVLDRNRILVARLIERNQPDRQTFDEIRDDFRASFIERNRGRFVDQFITEYHQEHEVDFNLEVSAEHFGVNEHKPGAPRPPQQQQALPTTP